MNKMFSFKDISTNPTYCDTTSNLEIKPSKNTNELSNAKAFWDNEFLKFSDAFDISDYNLESIFSEIYDCNEEDFILDFEFDNDILNALEQFNNEKWGKMSLDERMEAIKDFSKVLSDKLELKNSPNIEFYNDKQADYGGYDSIDNCIRINTYYIENASECIDTIAHELRHAYQHQRADDLETRTDLMYRINFDNYITPMKLANGSYAFFTDYQNQFVEAEARAFANLFKI